MSFIVSTLIGDLKSRRERLGLSAGEVADRCGIDCELLDQWERGSARPRLDAVERWAAALAVELVLELAKDRSLSGLQVDWKDRRITLNGCPVRLTSMEWKVLERLAATPGELVPVQELFQHVYGAEQPFRPQWTGIRVLIARLRRLLPPVQIEVRWGRGYMVRGIPPTSPDALSSVADRPAAPAIVEPNEVKGQIRSHSRRETGCGHMSTPRHRPIEIAPAGSRRTEELALIERFIAEQGVTRCPQTGTSQITSVPNLMWDRSKQKWVRPATVAG